MLRISGRKKLVLNVVSKIITSILVALSLILSFMFIVYKPVYKVSINGKDSGYVASKLAMEKSINNYIMNGDAENVAYVTMNSTIDYELLLLKKDIKLEENKILTEIKETCDVYYRVYAIKIDGEEKYIVDSLNKAEEIKNSIDEKQAKFSKKVDISIEEKMLMEYNSIDDIEVAVNDVISPLQKENDEIIAKQVKLAAAKSVDSSKSLTKTLKETLENLNFQKPVENGVITSRYGWRSTGYHYGLDIGAPLGTPIYASEDGTVTYSAWSGNYGYLIKIAHVDGYETYYAHCSKLVAEVGKEVAQGDLIGYVGSTGRSTGPHVHMEIRFNNQTLDPEVFIY